MDIGSLTGAIIIGDQFSSVITLGTSQVKAFAEGFDEMTGGLGTASILAVGAIGAVTTAVVALGERGSEINNVSNTLDTFAGSSENAKAILESLRTSTKGTVDDFELMRGAAQMLSAGVKLNAEEFGTLGTAAFDLAHRGFGSVDDMMSIVDRAMITGRTRQLAMKLGVVDNADALVEYAHKLGLAKDELTKAQTVEATRITILNMMQDAIKKTGDVQMNFSDTITAGIVSLKNWADEIAQAVDRSPDVRRALDAIGEGFRQVFGGDAKTMQEVIINGVNAFARAVTASIPYIVSFANSIKSVGQFIADNKSVIEDGIKVAGAFGAAWVVWSVGGALVTGVVAGLTAVTGGITAVTAAALANPFTAAAIAATAAGLAISHYAQSEADAAFATEVAGAKADAAAIAAKNHAAGHDAVAKAAAAATPPVNEMSKAAQSLYDSFFKAGNALNAITPAVGAVSDKMLANRAIQEAVVAELDKLIAAGKTLTERQVNIYDNEIKTTLALHEKSVEMGNASKATFDQINVLEHQGLSEKEIAFMLGMTTDALKLRKTTMKDLVDFEQTALKMSTEMWRTYSETVMQLTSTTFDDQMAAIEKWAEDQSTKIEEQAKKERLAGRDTTDFLSDRYSELATTIAAKYQAAFLDVKKIQATNTDDTLRGLQQTADARKRDFDFAITQSGTWSDKVINDSRKAYESAQADVANWGATTKDVYESNIDYIARLVAQQEKLTAEVNNTAAATKAAQDAANHSALAGTPTPNKFAGMSNFQLQSLGYLDAMGRVTTSGERAGVGTGPHFAEGGIVTVGEHGPERVALPYGAAVFPNGSGPSSGVTVQIMPGAVQMNYPIVSDRFALLQVAGPLVDVITQELITRGAFK